MPPSSSGSFFLFFKIAAACNREFGVRVDAFYGPFARYARSHKLEDLAAIQQAEQNLSAEVKEKKQRLKGVDDDIGDDPKKLKELANSGRMKEEEIPATIAAMTLAAVAIDLNPAIDAHFQAAAALEKLPATLAACK